MIHLTRAIPEHIRGGYELTTIRYANRRLLYFTLSDRFWQNVQTRFRDSHVPR